MTSNWKFVALGDVCDVIGGGTPPKDRAEFYGGNIPWATVRDMRSELITNTEFKITPLAVKSSSTNIIPKDNVVIATRVGLGKVCLLQQDTAINQDLRAIIPKDAKQLSVLFLFWWLKSVAHLIEAEGTGATVQGVKLPFIKSLPVPCPPLPEQQRIVAILDEAFLGLATATVNVKKNLRNARELFDSCLNLNCSKSDDDWVEKQLGEVCDLFQGLAINKGTKHLLVEKSSLPLLRIKDLRDESHEQYVAEVGYPPNSKVGPEDIIYTRTGQIGLVFRGRYGVLHNNCFKITPRSELAPSYLFWWLQNPYFREKITALASRMAQPDITHTIFKAQRICVPPLAYQRHAAEKFESLYAETQRLGAIFHQKLNWLSELKSSILRKAFVDELTSPPTQAIKEAAE